MYSSRAGKIVAISFCASMRSGVGGWVEKILGWCRDDAFRPPGSFRERYVSVRVIAGLVHVLQSEIIGFAFRSRENFRKAIGIANSKAS